MKKREADFTILFRHWLKANPMYSGAFELKQTTKNCLPFSDVKEHQLDALLAVKSKHGLLYKAPDDSRGVKPFDLFYLRNAFAYVVIKFPKSFHIIDAEMFKDEQKISKRKSLTEIRAFQISIKSVVNNSLTSA